VNVRAAALVLATGCRLSFEPCGDPARVCLANELGASGGPVDTGLAAPVLLFQPDYASMAPDLGGAVQRGGVDEVYSLGVYEDPAAGRTKLFVNDRLNNRVLIFSDVPERSGVVPDVVVGQIDFTSGAVNAGQTGPNAVGLDDPTDVNVCGTGEMFVSDANNHRVLVWRHVPEVSGTPADFVLGQPDFTTATLGTGPATFARPYAAQCIDRRLFVIDHDNSRILIYDPIPTSGDTLPAYVIGQPDFTSSTPGCSATQLSIEAYEIVHHDGRYYVADGGNHRVLVYDDSFATGNSTPLAVLGQADFTSCAINRGAAAPDAATLHYPNGVAARDDVLAISDHENRRIVFYRLPAATGDAAFAELGQASLDEAAMKVPPDAASLSRTKGLVFDGDFIWTTDVDNNRVVAMRLPAGG
jgi:hypothetical protein